jgi:hypothetical protein
MEAAATKAPATKRRTTPKRAPRRKPDQIAVTCTGAGPHEDLTGATGVLTLDYRDDRPITATFDPSDASIENAIIPIYGFLRGDREIVVQSDSARWRFTTTVLSLAE